MVWLRRMRAPACRTITTHTHRCSSARQASWRDCDGQPLHFLVQHYKAQLLSYVEYRTAALHHASSCVLAPLDRVQERLLRELGLTDADALEHFGLAPLQVRRDVAMLGVVHRAVLRKGPPQLWSFFTAAQRRLDGPTTRSAGRHRKQLQTYRTGHYLETVRRSALGCVDVYNELPPGLVETAASVRAFQGLLQALVLSVLRDGREHWRELLTTRTHSWERQLKELRGWSPPPYKKGCGPVPNLQRVRCKS